MSSAVHRIRLRPRAILAVLALTILSAPAVPVSAATVGDTQTYIVLYRAGASSSGAASVVQGAGGQLVANYSQIGVVIARSNRSDFAATVSTAKGVDAAVATAKFATSLGEDKLAGTDATTDAAVTTATPVADADTFSPLQWDMRQIDVPAAHAITGGSPSVVVGDIDTGLDFTHPDLAPNYDAANSANCITGTATPLLPGNDGNGHGTHTAGTIAAAANGIGIVGVAPNVRIAGIKAGNAAGFFFPEAVVCAFVWAGTHGFNVTNNSYFADPFYLNCHNDPVQRAIWKAEQRAIRFAMSQGVTVVAAAGNFADDLAHPTIDLQSPDDTTPIARAVHNDCVDIPVEIAGVLGVSALGNLQMKSFYSSYGVGVVEVAAPGGDSILQQTPAAPNGRVLSTWPSTLLTVTCLPARRLVDASGATYCYQQGTSMASPHAAGVAALVASQGRVKPGQIAATVQLTADPVSCPIPTTVSLYAFFPSQNNGAPQACQGSSGSNSWYGKGQVNALSAVTGP